MNNHAELLLLRGNHKNKVSDVVERKAIASSVMRVVRNPSEKTALTPSPLTERKRSIYCTCT